MKQREENRIAAKYYEDELTQYKRPEGDLDLFTRSGNRRNEVIIGGEDNDWDSYCTGYHRAASALIRYIVQEDLPRRRDYSRHWESIGYTILFLYRHYLELRLKKLFITCGGDLERVNNEHSLLKLWEIFFKQYEAFCKEYNLDSEEPSEESLKDIKTVETIITQFNELPPAQIDIVRLKEMLGWTSQFLDAWSDGIYECWQAELQSRYEAKHS